jgi:hypothetical protein
VVSALRRRSPVELVLDYPDGHRTRLRAGRYGATMPDGHRRTLTAHDLRALACSLVADGHARVVGPCHLAATAPRLAVLERIAQQAHEEARRAVHRP